MRTRHILFLVGLISLFCFLQKPLAQAEGGEEEAITGEKGEYDFSWLDPEKKIYVVQNRKYTKAKHMEMMLSGGFGMGQPYRSTWVMVPRLAYYFSESWGLSALGVFAANSENSNILELKQISASSFPNVRDVKSFVGGGAVWVPFYAKINTFNRIFYIDWHWEAGLASVSTQVDLNTSATGDPRLQFDNYMGFYWGTGQKFFVSKNFAVRLDLLGLYYKPNIVQRGVAQTTTQTTSNYYLTLGASYTF